MRAWSGPLGLALLFVALAAWSWRKWADPHIDFGSELYIAWRLSEGDALYRDIAHRHGPLSHTLNALWFRLFGVSIRTLVWCNLAVLAVLCAMLWRVFARACDRLTATLACGVLLGVFGFSQYTPIANFNYVTPYHHHQTHGLALALAMILCLGQVLAGRGAGWAAAAGLCLGGTLLTKIELSLPALAAAAAGLALAARARVAAAFAAGAVAPMAGFALWLAVQMPLEMALGGVAGNWRYLGTGLLADPFYAHGAGLDAPVANALRALAALAALGAFAGAASAADRLAPARLQRPRWSAALGVLCFAGLVAFASRPPWLGLARALPAVAALAAAVLLVRCVRGRGDRGALARWGPLALLAVLALGLLGKMPLAARFEQYGFALAMPASLLAVAALVWALPAALRARTGGGGLARALAVAAVCAWAVGLWQLADRVYAGKRHPVGRGGDALLVHGPPVSSRGVWIPRALAQLETHMAPADTLLVLPEGAALNYWLRKRNPTPFVLFLPTELAAFGGPAQVLEAVRAAPADFVALVHRRYGEFGTGPFGSSPRSGRGLLEWVEGAYEPFAQLGAEPFRDDGFGIVLLRRRPDRGAPAP